MANVSNVKEFLKFLESKNIAVVRQNGAVVVDGLIHFNADGDKIQKIDGVKIHHMAGLILDRKETFCSLMFLLLMKQEGVLSKAKVEMEKPIRLGRDDKRVDFFITLEKGVYVVESKSQTEFAGCLKNKGLASQLISYARQQKNTIGASYYSYDFTAGKDKFASIRDIVSLLGENDAEAALDAWDGCYDQSNFVEKMMIGASVISEKSLVSLNRDTIKHIKEKFLDILRAYAISDKPNAFLVFVNMILCKIYDEETGDKRIDRKRTGVYFQFVDGLDDASSLMKRMMDLYVKGTKHFLEKDISDYSDDQIEKIVGESPQKAKIIEAIDSMRLKRNGPFSFIDVYDDDTYRTNSGIVIALVKEIQSHKFRYNQRQQFLGDFFEEMLVTSLKQDEGQFFTPVPLVNFIVNALPVEKLMDAKIASGTPPRQSIPCVIDYACGAGHFLVSFIDRMQEILDKRPEVYTGESFDWIKKDNVVGIEKDYRLARTTKVASFFNGDGQMQIINGDGVNKFSSDDYMGTCLASKKSKIELFDYVIANPPYSVKGFMDIMRKNGVNKSDFSLFNENASDGNTAIEVYFVERAWQLLHAEGGAMAAILLPNSSLMNQKYSKMRKFILDNFEIKAVVSLGDITFFGTSTSPVVLFLHKPKGAVCQSHGTLFVSSEKAVNVKASTAAEKDFLGYQFSQNKNLPSIKKAPNNRMEKEFLRPLKAWLAHGKTPPSNSNMWWGDISEFCLNDDIQVFPNYRKQKGTPLGDIMDSVSLKGKPSAAAPYIEISNIKNGRIHSTSPKKHGGVLCKKGDILVSSLTPSKDKMCIADGNYVVSSAIFVLRKKNPSMSSKELIGRLQSDNVVTQMNSMLEGFKITYSKIQERNLLRHVNI